MFAKLHLRVQMAVWLVLALRGPSLGPSWVQVGPRWLRAGPRWLRYGPKMGPRSPKMANMSQTWPKRAQAGPRWHEIAPIWPQDGPQITQGDTNMDARYHKYVQESVDYCKPLEYTNNTLALLFKFVSTNAPINTTTAL